MVDGRQQTAGTPLDCPIWVNESGWTESRPELDRDITKWLAGTGYGVLVAIETKYTRRQNSRVAGYVIFYTNNGTTINRKVRVLLIILIPLYLNYPRKSSPRHRILLTIWLRTRDKTSLGIRYLLNPDKPPEISIFSMFRSYAVEMIQKHKGWVWRLFNRRKKCLVARPKCVREELKGDLLSALRKGDKILYILTLYKIGLSLNIDWALSLRRPCQAQV
jgi:hypothetical protein